MAIIPDFGRLGTKGRRRLRDRIDEWVIDRPGTVLFVFLILTTLFAGGLGVVETEAGTEQFVEDIPENEALERINQEFGPRFTPDTGSTQLIQRGGNVLSKNAMLRMLAVQERMGERTDLRVTSTSSAAAVVARTIDPDAQSIEAQRRSIEQSTETELRRAIRANADNPAFTRALSQDFNPVAATASATIGVVSHEIPGAGSTTAGQGGESPLTTTQQRSQRIADAEAAGDITVFGSGIVAEEFSQVIADSLIVVTPLSFLLVVVFLVFAYRDLVDLVLGIGALGMTVVWTFGFLGFAGIPFNQLMIAVPPLLLAVGIDFGIHSINRYREEIAEGIAPERAMDRATGQLLTAFFIVTGTTAIGFLSNLVSDLVPIREFGVVAAIGIGFTFLIFGIFLPAAKLWTDRARRRIGLTTPNRRPLGSAGSPLGRVLSIGAIIAGRAPLAVLVLALLASVGAGVYATGIDTSFDQRDFLPPEEPPSYLDHLPAALRPGTYTVTAQLNYLEDNFASAQGGSTTVYLQAHLHDPTVLTAIDRAGRDPPSSFVRTDRQAAAESILTVIRSQTERDPEFARLVDRNDRDGDGIPDQNLERVYDALLDSPVRDEARQYISADRRSARVVYQVRADADDRVIAEDTRTVATRFRVNAVASGESVVFQAISDLIFMSAIRSLLLALCATVVFLVVVYGLLEGLPSLGLANAVPVALVVALLAGSMRGLEIPFNAVTATVLALTIGLGVDYAVHITHRYIDERRHRGVEAALDRTVRGTGGALTGSMLTTVAGVGVLVLAVLDVIGQFGVLTGLSIVYAFFGSVIVLPAVLVVWDRLVIGDATAPLPERHR